MSVFFGNTPLTGGASGSGGGGGIPETEIFNVSGAWLVPDSVQDEITAEGHAEIGLLMVGGGATEGSGEVVSELYPLTTGDYDTVGGVVSDPPTVSVIVGASGGHTGLTTTVAPVDFPETIIPIGTGLLAAHQTVGQLGSPFPIDDGTPGRGANGLPLITSITVTSTGVYSGVTAVFDDDLSYDGSGNPTIAGRVATFANPTEWDGTFSWTMRRGTQNTTTTFTVRYDIATNQIFQSTSSGTTALTSEGIAERQTNGLFATFRASGVAIKQAREGNHDDANQFLNNDTSEEGVLGGWARFNGERPNSGSGGTLPQSGYLQIFYS